MRRGAARACKRVPWSALAARCGYFDQAHLSRDFHHFCGFAPGEFLRHARADATSIVLR
jgi:AraC-like DNA-binding protein